MNINETGGASLYEQLNLTHEPTPPKDNESLGQSDFLALMTTQLQNQDPFAPMENGDFLAQMAQFGTVSGIEGLQSSFDGFSAAMQSNSALEASVLVGREVLIPGDRFTLAEGAGMNGAVGIPQGATNVTVKVHNGAGELVATIEVPDEAGFGHFSWDGLDAEGNPVPAGEYTLSAEAQLDNSVEQLPTLVAGNVDSVTLGLGPGDFTLHVAGIGDVGMGDVVQIN